MLRRAVQGPGLWVPRPCAFRLSQVQVLLQTRGYAKRDVDLLVLHDEEGLGTRGARITVSPGYARNVLVRERKCVYATLENERALAEAMRQEAAERQWRRRYHSKPWVSRWPALQALREKDRSSRVQAWKAARRQYRELVREAGEEGVTNPNWMRDVVKGGVRECRSELRAARARAREVYGDASATEKAKERVRKNFLRAERRQERARAVGDRGKAVLDRLRLAQQWADILRRELVTGSGRAGRVKRAKGEGEGATSGWWEDLGKKGKSASSSAADTGAGEGNEEDGGEGEDGEDSMRRPNGAKGAHKPVKVRVGWKHKVAARRAAG